MSEVCSQCGTVIDNPLDAYGQFGNALCRECWLRTGDKARRKKSRFEVREEWAAYNRFMMPASRGMEAEVHNLEVFAELDPETAERLQQEYARKGRDDE